MGIEDKYTATALIDIYNRLFDRYGPQRWWPANGPFEVIVGAILTQSAAWTNVEHAISNLKAANALTPAALHDLPIDRLAHFIHPCGYFNAKALKLKAFAERLHSRHNGDLERLFTLDTASLRRELLSIHGVGEETADSILLYAARRPSFVIDAYTKRILSRLGLAPAKEGYGDFQALFAQNLPQDERLFNEYHALLVRHGKEVCRKAPDCPRCCLRTLCPY